jgi:tripartite-type tricarboxylate transporter receptor subunit TctC
MAMSSTRRDFLTAMTAAAGAAAIPNDAWPQSFPSHAVRIVVPLPAGGTTDVIARAVTQWLAPLWTQSIVIENKSGGSTRIGAEFVAKAAPDGHTLLATAEATFVVNPHIYPALPYRLSDFAPISGLGVSTHVLVAHPSMPVSSVADMIALAKAKPGELNYGTFGAGSSSHLNMEMFQTAAGVRLKPIHYRGAAPMMTDLIGGHIPIAFTGATLAIGPAKAGQLKILGVGGEHRLTQLPDVPPIADILPGFQAISWFGLFAPAKTPATLIARINADVQRVLADPEFKEKFLDPNQLQPIIGSPDAFTQYVEADAAKWGKVVKDAKITVE